MNLVPCNSCKNEIPEIPAGTPFYEVDQQPKCKDCCIKDGTKSSPMAPTPAEKPEPKTASEPVPCKKCNRTIPAGNKFYEVNNAPKCKDCCIVGSSHL
ncbi:hypothetical protein COOONC_21042 [Cooperia oncophora]